MCATCGCGEAGVRLDGVAVPRADQAHGHGHGHEGGASGGSHGGEVISLEQRVLAKNDHLAAHNRAWLAERAICAINLMSSPGSGKTTLLERTIRELSSRRQVAVVEGDQETALDADRIRATGCPVVQVNTGAGCHLDVDMLHRALQRLDPPRGSLVLVENVGNLVCPSLFDLAVQGQPIFEGPRGSVGVTRARVPRGRRDRAGADWTTGRRPSSRRRRRRRARRPPRAAQRGAHRCLTS